MMAKSRLGAIALTFALSYPLAASADELIVPLAKGGDWVAMEHKTSTTAPPDVCLAINLRAGIAFRADGDTVQLRVIDEKWSLPASVQGNLLIIIGDWNLTLEISSNTGNSISAEVEQTDLQALLATMDKAATMAVTVGKAKPIKVSLAGSSKVANAFRTCARIGGSSEKGGENPFK